MFCFLVYIYYRGILYFFLLCIYDLRNMSNVFVKKYSVEYIFLIFLRIVFFIY